MIKSESCWWKEKRSEHRFYATMLVDCHLHILGSMVTTRTLTNSKVLQYRVYPVTEDLVIPQSGKTLCMVQAHTGTHALGKVLPCRHTVFCHWGPGVYFKAEKHFTLCACTRHTHANAHSHAAAIIDYCVSLCSFSHPLWCVFYRSESLL